MVKKTKCLRCGELKLNNSELCFKCNKLFQKYMNDYPLKVNWLDYSVKNNLRIIKAGNKRYNNFLNKKFIFR